MRMPVFAVAALFLIVTAEVWISVAALAQTAPTSNYTSVEAIPNKALQLGYYASAHKSNCTPAPMPTIRVRQNPKSGLLIVRRATLTTNNVPGCPGLKIPAQVVFYQARGGAAGSDHVVYEVTNANGEVGNYDVSITIKEAPKANPASKDKRI